MKHAFITIIAAAITLPLAAQDSAYVRNVTVERDYQPTIQEAQKIQTQPQVVEETMTPVEVKYSDYSNILSPVHNVTPMGMPKTSFKSSGQYNGYIRGGFGHTGTLLDFEYALKDQKSSTLNVYAHHRAEWGLRTLSKSNLGLDFTHSFQHSDLYFGVKGGNLFYHKYGRIYDYQNGDNYLREIGLDNKIDKTALWTAEAFVGVKSNKSKSDFKYRFQTGYALYSKIGTVTEHQVRTSAQVDWKTDVHHVGGNLYVQNNMIQLGSLSNDITEEEKNKVHNIRIEPYYEYQGKRIIVHAGVNMDVNIGRGKMLSGSDNISFLPSPNIYMEAQVAKQWLTLYASAKGSFGLGNLQSFMESNRYRLIHAGVVSTHVTSYSPIDAELGLHIRPTMNLMIELHGGYGLLYNQCSLIATTEDGAATQKRFGKSMNAGAFGYAYSDYGRGKIGGIFDYHYRDMVHVKAWGDYYIWRSFGHEAPGYTFTNPAVQLDSATVYDRPSWKVGLRIDGRIDSHWSLYSDNRFEGARTVMATDGEHTLAPMINLGLGCKYEMAVGKKVVTRGERQMPNLELFLQLDNIMHRHNDIYYGYQTQGIQFLLGALYRF